MMNTFISDDDSLARGIFETMPTTESSLVTGSARFERNNGWYIYATENGTPIGYIASNVFDDHISVSIVVRGEYRGRGVGEQLGCAMVKEMHRRGYGYMIWRAALCNVASQRVVEKIGGEYIETSDAGWLKYKVS